MTCNPFLNLRSFVVGVVATSFLDKMVVMVDEKMHPVAATLINGFVGLLKEGLMWIPEDGALTQVSAITLIIPSLFSPRLFA